MVETILKGLGVWLRSRLCVSPTVPFSTPKHSPKTKNDFKDRVGQQ